MPEIKHSYQSWFACMQYSQVQATYIEIQYWTPLSWVIIMNTENGGILKMSRFGRVPPSLFVYRTLFFAQQSSERINGPVVHYKHTNAMHLYEVCAPVRSMYCVVHKMYALTREPCFKIPIVSQSIPSNTRRPDSDLALFETLPDTKLMVGHTTVAHNMVVNETRFPAVSSIWVQRRQET